MISLSTRLGALSPYTQATAFTVASPFKTLQPVIFVTGDKVLLDPQKTLLCRESVNGQTPRTGPSVRVSINGKHRSKVAPLAHCNHLISVSRPSYFDFQVGFNCLNVALLCNMR